MKNLKAVLLGATFLIGAASVANAADVYERGSYKDAPEAYMPALTWTGFYIGANVGSSFDDSTSVEILGFDLGEIDFDNSLVAGAQIGYNYQLPSNIVIGVEADLGIMNDELPGLEIDVSSYLASIRARLGYSFGRGLIYATGGVAFQGYDDDIADLLDDDPSVGWVAGGGFDYKLTNNVSLGAEALYYEFENSIADVIDLERDFWTVRARLNYHFN